MKQAVVTAPRCPLMSAPTLKCPPVDELLSGWSVYILDTLPHFWYRVRTDYGYHGFAPAGALCADSGRVSAFCALPKAALVSASGTVLAAPKVQSWTVSDLLRGAWVAPLSPPDAQGWQRVALAGGKEGYIQSNLIQTVCTTTVYDPSVLRGALVRTALSYRGTAYRWGGKSPLGIDCSGLAFMTYRLNGVTIYRDARIEPNFPVREISAEQMGPGDLLYFPGHMAVSLGRGHFVHATTRGGSVTVNSLDSHAPGYRADLANSLQAVGSIFDGGTPRPDARYF